MKMKKRISCIVLSLLLVLCFVPTTVMAEGEDKISAINLEIKPILGAKVLGEYGNDGGIHVKSANITPNLDRATRSFFTVAEWYKILNDNYTGNANNDKSKMEKITEANEVFQDGYHYYVITYSYYCAVENKQYSKLPFNDGILGTINGKEVSVELIDSKYTLSMAAYVDVSGFYNIDMKVATPTLGTVADYKPTYVVTENLCEDYYGLGITTIEKTTWFKVEKDAYKGVDSAWVEMKDGEEYATGYYYMVKFNILETNKNDEYNFDYLYRTISKNLKGSLNDKDFDKIVVAGNQYSAELYKCFEPLSEPEPVKSYDSKDKNQDGIVDCEEEMNSKDWIWSNTKGACVYKVSNTSVK